MRKVDLDLDSDFIRHSKFSKAYIFVAFVCLNYCLKIVQQTKHLCMIVYI